MLVSLLMIYLYALFCDIIGFKLLSAFFNQFTKYGILIMAIIFQPEMRRILLVLGRNRLVKRMRRFKRHLFKSQTTDKENKQINYIADALSYMAKRNIGAIIVIQQTASLNQYSDTGVKIYGEISSKLIESIFSKDSPLHDGAMIIEDYLIKAAGCTLPVSDNPENIERIGLRHKSAIGVTEISDAIAFIVSEEKGTISVAFEGQIDRGIDKNRVLTILRKIYSADS
jgi:diadenylate cyclase